MYEQNFSSKCRFEINPQNSRKLNILWQHGINWCLQIFDENHSKGGTIIALILRNFKRVKSWLLFYGIARNSKNKMFIVRNKIGGICECIAQ